MSSKIWLWYVFKEVRDEKEVQLHGGAFVRVDVTNFEAVSCPLGPRNPFNEAHFDKKVVSVVILFWAPVWKNIFMVMKKNCSAPPWKIFFFRKFWIFLRRSKLLNGSLWDRDSPGTWYLRFCKVGYFKIINCSSKVLALVEFALSPKLKDC